MTCRRINRVAAGCTEEMIVYSEHIAQPKSRDERGQSVSANNDVEIANNGYHSLSFLWRRTGLIPGPPPGEISRRREDRGDIKKPEDILCGSKGLYRQKASLPALDNISRETASMKKSLSATK